MKKALRSTDIAWSYDSSAESIADILLANLDMQFRLAKEATIEAFLNGDDLQQAVGAAVQSFAGYLGSSMYGLDNQANKKLFAQSIEKVLRDDLFVEFVVDSGTEEV